MGAIIHLIDRSRVEAREECPRMRFLNYDFENEGIESETGSLPLLSGIAIHSAHARLLAGQPLETVVSEIIRGYVDEIKLRGLFGLDVTNTLIKEQAHLLECMLRVWAATRMPVILAEYEVVSIEQTFDWELSPGLAERLRYDVLLRRRDDGLLHILDYKTVAYPSDIWFEKFEHSLQTNLYLQALRERYPDEPIGGILYEGLVKGQFKKDTAKSSPWYGEKLQNSPYTIAYALRGEVGTIYQSEWTNKKGYVKVRVHEEMTAKEWVEHHLLPGGLAMTPVNELFISVPAIMPPFYELERAKLQTVREELAYHRHLGDYRELAAFDSTNAEPFLDKFAPLRTGRCFKYGADNRCAFIGICFNQGVEPLAEGSGFRKRTPHHDVDLEFAA